MTFAQDEKRICVQTWAILKKKRGIGGGRGALVNMCKCPVGLRETWMSGTSWAWEVCVPGGKMDREGQETDIPNPVSGTCSFPLWKPSSDLMCSAPQRPGIWVFWGFRGWRNGFWEEKNSNELLGKWQRKCFDSIYLSLMKASLHV